MIIKLLIEGGEMKVNPTIAQKIGPLGLNMGKIISDINSATSSFKGMRVPITLDINVKTKQYKVEVATPPTAELIKKEIGVEKGTSASSKEKVGNAAMEQIIKVAKTKQEGMLVNNFKSAVKTVVGSCVSLGILIESKDAKEIENEINEGKYDDIIENQIENADTEKLKKLEEEFSVIKAEQEKIAKAEAEAKAAEEAAKTAEAGTETEAKAEEATTATEIKEPATKAEPKKEEKKK